MDTSVLSAYLRVCMPGTYNKGVGCFGTRAVMAGSWESHLGLLKRVASSGENCLMNPDCTVSLMFLICYFKD